MSLYISCPLVHVYSIFISFSVKYASSLFPPPPASLSFEWEYAINPLLWAKVL